MNQMYSSVAPRFFTRFLVSLVALALAANAAARPMELYIAGNEIQGGAKEKFGETKFGEKVNYVYSRANGAHSKMEFAMPAVSTSDTVLLHIRGRDDEQENECDIRITLGEHEIYKGPSGFSSSDWSNRSFPIPAGALVNDTTCTITNIETTGPLGNPPWFMVAACAIGPEGASLTRDITRDFRVDLPETKQPFPHPLPEGKKPAYAWRGTKGWLWKPEQYLATIPHLPKCGMNFLMNCYGSMCDIENVPWGDPNCNRWYEPLPPAKKAAYEGVVKAAQDAGLTFCFSMNPNLSSSRFVRPDNKEDMEALWHHYSWMQDLGVQWFNISLDDITQGIDPAAQCRVVNEIRRRLLVKDPEAQMIFCPTFYWGHGTDDKAKVYLEVIAKELDPEIYLFWTGEGVVGKITREAAESFAAISKHPLFLWDNYPVNDGSQAMHLAPVMHRDHDLHKAIVGYMANPLHTQTDANLIPTYTCGDYAWNPEEYDPARSIGQAILHLAETKEQQEALKELVEYYSGMLVHQVTNTGFNTVRDQFTRIVTTPHSRHLAENYRNNLANFLERFDKLFPNNYTDTKRTIKVDIDWMTRELTDRYGANPAN